MPEFAIVVLAVLAAYLVGSVPFAVVCSKLFGLADPRSYGSKNPGATNVLRSGNKIAAAMTLLGDMAKGWLAVFLAQLLAPKYGFADGLIGAVALAVFFGHLYPIFLGRDSPERLAQLPISTPMGQQITLGTVASISITDGPPMLKSENARPSGWVYVDVRGRDLASVANDLRDAVSRQIKLEPGVSITYSGQFEYLERANARLKVVVPATLLIIFVLLYLTFSRMGEAGLIMATLPFALTGGIWFLYLMNYNLSIATGVGFIALAGVAAEFGVVMLIYLKQALAERCPDGRQPTLEELLDAIREGAVLRVRPKAMTVAVILAGLVPIVWSSGTGSEVMSRIAAPMLGGMVTAPLLSLFVIPAAYVLMRRPSKHDQLDTDAS